MRTLEPVLAVVATKDHLGRFQRALKAWEKPSETPMANIDVAAELIVEVAYLTAALSELVQAAKRDVAMGGADSSALLVTAAKEAMARVKAARARG